jgi:hypothetical protein
MIVDRDKKALKDIVTKYDRRTVDVYEALLTLEKGTQYKVKRSDIRMEIKKKIGECVE